MKTRILIFGKGYLGQRLAAEFSCGLTDARVNSLEQCIKDVSRYKPQVVINAIGQTGARNVDDCEMDKDKTLMSNSFVPVILAEACLRCGVRFVHISSGCIFEYDYAKQRPITEDRIPDYYDLYYSRSKVYAERCLDYLAAKFPVLTVRVRIPLDDRPGRKNIIDKLVKYGKVIDVPNSVTYVPDFVEMVRHLIAVKANGIFNTVNKGGLYYRDLMETYRKYVPDFAYKVIPLSSLKLKRTNLLLSTKKLEATGFKVRPIKSVLDECIQRYIANSGRP